MIDQSLAGPTSHFVKFSTLQQYGVDKVFFLEKNNLDASQKNVVFLTRGENADRPLAIAGKSKGTGCNAKCIVLYEILYHV